ncbi:hypothetical protein AB7M49_004247 [Bradyrhizobium elkanii]
MSWMVIVYRLAQGNYLIEKGRKPWQSIVEPLL